MRIITKKHLTNFAERHPDVAPSINRFIMVLRGAKWSNIDEVRNVFPHADLVKVSSGNTVTVFNLAGNKYRVATAIHYDQGNIYILAVLTHEEYNQEKWKGRL